MMILSNDADRAQFYRITPVAEKSWPHVKSHDREQVQEKNEKEKNVFQKICGA